MFLAHSPSFSFLFSTFHFSPSSFSLSLPLALFPFEKGPHDTQEREGDLNLHPASIAMRINMSSQVNVVSYNVLSSKLAASDYFRHCEKANLKASTRFNRLLPKLEEHIEKGAVIALQEVSIDWVGDLHTFFLERGYVFVSSLYSSRFSGRCFYVVLYILYFFLCPAICWGWQLLPRSLSLVC